MNEGKFVEQALSDTQTSARARSHVRLFSGDGSWQLLLPVPANRRPRGHVQVSSSTVTNVSYRDCLLPEVVGVTAARPGG